MPKVNAERLGDSHKLAVYGHRPDFVDRFSQGDELDVGRHKGHHHPVLAGFQHLHSTGAECQPNW